MSQPILEVAGLACERDDRILFEHLDLELAAGAAVQIRGANGAGKTTLLRCIAGLHVDFAGSIRIDGLEHPDAHERVLFFGHRAGLSAPLTAAENLSWHQSLAGREPDAAEIAVALERVGLGGWDKVPCAQMSAGQQRRVALARLALLSSAPLWLLDEPFTALDDSGTEIVVSLLNDHVGRGGAVLFATHQSASGLSGLMTLRMESGQALLEAAA